MAIILRQYSRTSSCTTIQNFSRQIRKAVDNDAEFRRPICWNPNPTGTLSEQRIITAIEKVGLWESICRKGGLDATFNSLDWSYDERQLLALARALATPSPLLILDEATSGVDWETESRILEIIEQECAGQTVIAVMHRLRHIERFDKVALLQHVELVEFDAPRALLGRESEFRKLHTASHKRGGLYAECGHLFDT